MRLILFLAIAVVPYASLAISIRELLKPSDPQPFEDTDLGANFATRKQLRVAGLLRRRLRV